MSVWLVASVMGALHKDFLTVCGYCVWALSPPLEPGMPEDRINDFLYSPLTSFIWLSSALR
jgi:hypothetical protein